MPKVTPLIQRDRVVTLAKQGMGNTDIAREMKKEFPDEWSSQYAHRTVARILKEAADKAIIKPTVDPEKTLDEMSREERYRLIESKLQTTPRFIMTFRNFEQEEKGVFVDEYLGLIKSLDTLTEPEEQALFAAVLELILAFQALGRKEQEEKYRDMSLRKEILEDDPRYRRHVDDKYHREYDQHMKLYQKGIEGLKMSRSQRLKEVRSQKVTLVDIAEQLSNKNVQAEVADEIERLAKLKNHELKSLLDAGHIHGVFQDFI